MLALSLSDKFCCFGIFVFVFVNENHTADTLFLCPFLSVPPRPTTLCSSPVSFPCLNCKFKQGIHRHQTPPRYRNATRGGPSHGHRGSAQKIRDDRSSISRDMLADRQTDRQTNRPQYSSPLPGRSENLNFIGGTSDCF